MTIIAETEGSDNNADPRGGFLRTPSVVRNVLIAEERRRSHIYVVFFCAKNNNGWFTL